MGCYGRLCTAILMASIGSVDMAITMSSDEGVYIDIKSAVMDGL
jgi:hypothetical protein